MYDEIPIEDTSKIDYNSFGILLYLLIFVYLLFEIDSQSTIEKRIKKMKNKLSFDPKIEVSIELKNFWLDYLILTARKEWTQKISLNMHEWKNIILFIPSKKIPEIWKNIFMIYTTNHLLLIIMKYKTITESRKNFIIYKYNNC